MVADGTTSARSPTAGPPRKSPRNFTFEDGSVRKYSSTSPTKQSSVSPRGTVQENLISPSKMKKRIGPTRRRPNSTRSPTSSSASPSKPISPKSKESQHPNQNVSPRNDHGDIEQRSPKASARKSRNDSSRNELRESEDHAVEDAAKSSQQVRPPEDGHANDPNEPSNADDEADENYDAYDDESPRTKEKRKMFENLREPDPSLKDLLDVLVNDKTSHLRRVNACGAIKTLTLNKNNQVALARTKGVVTSITSVLCHVDATEEERTRCINALMHLCVPEKNWRLVYAFPHTAEALARNMADRYPQIRYAACLALSFMAKKNRKEMVTNNILMHSIARVIEVDRHGALERISAEDKKVFVGSRLIALKMLLLLSKNKDVSVQLARTDCIISSLVRIASTMELAANILCVAVMTNLTRHPDNASHLVYNVPGLVQVLVSTCESTDQESCKCSLYALQNLACAGTCRQELANAPNLLAIITKNAFKTQYPEQQLSALYILKNLSDDPFNLVTMTNTPGCTATLLALANDSSNTMAQFLACDTLATLSHWLLTLSAAKRTNKEDPDVGRRTFQTATWEMWK